jgi:hypothetical protein
VWRFRIASQILCPLPSYDIFSLGGSERRALTTTASERRPHVKENSDLKWKDMNEEQRKALIDSKRQYCEGLKQMVYERLHPTCECGSTNRLRLRFRDPKHPMKHRFTHHPETLHSLMLKNPEFFAQLALTCGSCRLKQHYAAKA